MILTADYTRKVITVTHSDGTVETFPTRSAALAAYPELAPPPLVTTDRSRDKRERRETGEIRKRDGRWMS